MTIKTVTSSELRTNVKRVLNEVEYGAERYIIEKFGEPTAAIISIEDFQLFQAIQAILDEAEAKRREGGSHEGQPPPDLDGGGGAMSQNELVESLMKLLRNPEELSDATKNYMQNDLIHKLLVTVQYLDAQISRLEAEMKVTKEGVHAGRPEDAKVTSPHGAYWNQFIGAMAGEAWERPDQGVLEVREAW